MSTPSPRFEFGPYIVRPAREEDRPTLAAWIEADPDHRGRVSPDFFLHALPGEECWALELRYDPRPVFWFKTQVACRVHIQFGPAVLEEDRDRNRDAMRDGLEWITDLLAAHNFRELLFSSTCAPLIASATRRLGFRASPHELVRSIPCQATTGGHHEPLLPELSAWEGEGGQHVR